MIYFTRGKKYGWAPVYIGFYHTEKELLFVCSKATKYKPYLQNWSTPYLFISLFSIQLTGNNNCH